MTNNNIEQIEVGSQTLHRCKVCRYMWVPVTEEVVHSQACAPAQCSGPLPGKDVTVVQTPEKTVFITAPAPEPLALNTVHQGNCLDLLPRVASGSVDMVMTSPPYDNLRAYKGYSFDFEGVARELYRVVKPGGVVVWVVADKTSNGSESGVSFSQALYFKSIGFNLWDTMIYRKASQPRETGPRYEQQFEYMFVLSKGQPKTFNPLQVACKYAGRVATRTCRDNHSDGLSRSSNVVAATRKRDNVWDYGSKNNPTGHPAVFPLQLAVDHIESWSNPSDVVLDPFFGSGTTGVACQQLGRSFIGLEISLEYAEIARQRLRGPEPERKAA